VQYKVAGGPDGEVVFHTVITDGCIVESALGEDPDADFTMSAGYDDFARTITGELDMNAGYMQGRIKVVGNMGSLLSLMPMTQSDEFKAITEKIDAATEY
jgi:putative sterol carrier protein